MKVSYKGVPKTLVPKLEDKLEAKFSKLSRLLERRGEKEAHVVVTAERHLHHAEITLQFYDHQLVGIGAGPDPLAAVHSAIEKLEKQAVKQRDRWREKSRRSDIAEPRETAAALEPKEAPIRQRVFRVNKPMTLDEALLEMEKERDYLVYRDARNDGISVLVRCRDGHLDLIES